MQFSSGTYLAFIGTVFFAYWAGSGSRLVRLAVILLANLLFCAHYGLFYVVLVPSCAALDFLVGLGLTRLRGRVVRSLLMGLSVAVNVTLLVGSRHAGLLPRFITGSSGWDWVFPLGLSFYALQSLTYTVDLYRRDGEGSSSLLDYLSAASFFPTLQAGPITRLTELVKQFAARPILSRADGGRAFFLICLGLLKKVLIADYLANNLVNQVFDTPKLYSGVEALIAVYAYSLQLYYDFSGYTDITRGAALLLGIKLPINFDRPYRSANLPEFWRRWHISFSNWLRDYVYFSLPGARTKILPYANIIITMVLGGLWHGTTWTFAIWGLLHGTALATTRSWWKWRGRPVSPVGFWRSAIAVFFTYQFVCFTWIFFRAATLPDALALLGRIGSLTSGLGNISALIAVVLLVSGAALFVTNRAYDRLMNGFALSPSYVHVLVLLLVALAIQLLSGHGAAPFVYSRF